VQFSAVFGRGTPQSVERHMTTHQKNVAWRKGGMILYMAINMKLHKKLRRKKCRRTETKHNTCWIKLQMINQCMCVYYEIQLWKTGVDGERACRLCTIQLCYALITPATKLVFKHGLVPHPQHHQAIECHTACMGTVCPHVLGA
jgi:hypothetical protein